MDNEKILLDALNTFGNFTSVEQEFNYNQLEVIYEAMNQVLHIANVVGRSEQLANFCKKISKQEDCPAEFQEIVNKEFWNLIG